jgi:stage II sporulation protein D
MFKRAVTFILLFLLVTTSTAFASQELPQTYTFQGSGYGHGVGMSQVGALGQALAGDTATAILQYYYTGVTVAPVEDDQLLRVNIGHLLTAFSLKTDTKLGQMALFNGDLKESTDSIAIQSIPAKASLNFTLLGNVIFPSVTSTGGATQTLPSGKIWTIRWTGTRYMPGAPAVLSVKTANTSTRYRYGEIQVKLVKAGVLGYRIEATNTVRLHDEYLWGIGEMPSAWPLEALRAQAIASRSYALNKVGKYKSSCDCDIYGSSQDQAFVGYYKEIEPRYGQFWKAAVISTAVDQTSGLAILYKNAPIAAYYFSSSGGNTAAAIDAWGTALPYAVSVPDPWSLDSHLNSKYAHWERSISESAIDSAFGLPDILSLQIVYRNASGSVGKIIATSSNGKKISLMGETFRSRVNLPSAWFDVAVSQMSPASPLPTPTSAPTPTATPTLTPTPSLTPNITPAPVALPAPTVTPEPHFRGQKGIRFI